MKDTISLFISELEPVQRTVENVSTTQVQDLEAGLAYIETETEEIKHKVESLGKDSVTRQEMHHWSKELIDFQQYILKD